MKRDERTDAFFKREVARAKYELIIYVVLVLATIIVGTVLTYITLTADIPTWLKFFILG